MASATRKSAARRGDGSTSASWWIRAAPPGEPGVGAGGSGSGQLDDQRRVVRRLLALAGVAVDQRPLNALADGRRAQHQVDPHADPLVEVARPVVPPREHALGVGVHVAEDVGEAPVEQLPQRLALGLAHVGGVDELGDVPHVGVGRGDVEVAAQSDVAGGVGHRVEVADEPVEPPELVLVVLVVEGAPVGDVRAHHADPAAGGGDQAGLRIRVRPVAEPQHHVVDADAADDGHAVPPAFAVVDAVVAEGREGHGRERRVSELRLLHAQHVGLALGQPRLHPLLAGVQRVDVPRREAHRPRTLPGRRGAPAR